MEDLVCVVEVACMREMRWDALVIGMNGRGGVGVPVIKAGEEEAGGEAGGRG
jgi:hypothetical protein